MREFPATPSPTARAKGRYDDISKLAIESFPVVGPRGLPERCVTIAGVHPRILFALDRPEVNLAILHRDLPEHLTGSALSPLLAAGPFTVLAKGKPASIPGQLDWLLPAAAPLDLLQDIGDLAAVFSMLDLHRGEVQVRLEASTNKIRTRWHADSVGMRMLCTYHGPGTEWLSLDGGAEAARHLSRSDPPRATGQIPTGAIAVMKGEGHPDTKGSACIHRSPRNSACVGGRLLMCIDQPQWNLEDDLHRSQSSRERR